jgi:histidine triad (HIT) family protein
MTYDKNNVFARIIRGEIPCAEVYNDDYVLAFRDMHPAAPVHVLVVPKGEFTSFDDFTTKADGETIVRFFATVRKIANDLGVSESGYRLITNHGPDASQTVPHFHLHILGGRPLGGLVRGDELNR